ncbi:segregation and condensation protein A [Gemelliphila palaticanis]|uniref:Segregation and condensation protein A n=1 Tax=Gemelliphila palaticanis TaxID=81950 RepID=A0ABX2SY13_9BACL|nr:segregation/condensation protein A [Gemella palaticanis]MBF0715247.1 segregation/condensation protein A [Gemella palaticanis]NYS47177.1 segregation/condensation protein A [Gemella palaticanis]
MYKVDLEVFQGPLDLLLHLIEKMEIDIHNVSILKLTESYLEYIHSVDEISLNNAEEYIVMASTLIHMKSKSLLPKENYYNEEEFNEEDLVQQLVEYKNYRELCFKFEELRKEREKFGEKSANDIPLNISLSNMSVESLYSSFKRVISNIDSEQLSNVQIKYRKEVSLDLFKDTILKHISNNKRVVLDEILTNYETRYEIVVAFLSILDLISKNNINVIDENEKVYLEIIY